MTEKLTADLLLSAYAQGYFPMAQSRDAKELYWFYPEMRGVIPLDDFHVPASLVRFMKKKPFAISVDKAFPEVIRACAAREDTWINDEIIALYCELFEMGFAHSVECWQDLSTLSRRERDGASLGEGAAKQSISHAGTGPHPSPLPEGEGVVLIGGLYGVSLGGAFFGESMFSRAPNASKVALVHLMERLKNAGYQLLDTQYVNDHLKQFGAVEIPRAEYLLRLEKALKGETGVLSAEC